MQLEVVNKDTTLYTLVSGSKNSETVILLHGGPGTPEDMQALIDFLAPYFQVIYFHQRGTVKSPCPSEDYSMYSYVSDIESIASHFNLKKFHLFGHSWGGLYAGLYAERRSNRIISMFLCSPASGTGAQWMKMGAEINKYNQQRCSFLTWLVMNKNAFLASFGSDSETRMFYRHFAINSNKGFNVRPTAPLLLELATSAAVTGTTKEIIKYGILREFRKSHVKITVTFGDTDIYGESAKYVRERYPSAAFITIPQCGHMQWLHNENDFFKTIAHHFDLTTYNT